jgi:hypothetical protein
MAQAGGLGADQDLARARLVDLDVFDLERLADFAQDSSFSSNSSAVATSSGMTGMAGRDLV